ncbi:MAG: hypothetical protein J7L61_02735 [Thermoplasmata archaeon]|nr:hypothetical protein [Thermoplasmata archaeon]
MPEQDTEKITIRLPKRFLRVIDQLVDADYYGSRTEAIRTAVRELVKQAPDLLDSMDPVERISRERERKELDTKRYLSP